MAVLRDVIAPGPVALLDYPHYFNAGDHLIYAGTAAYLDRLGCSVDYVCAPHTYDARLLVERVPTGPILLQGGGNFGDRWPMHQVFREKVIADFPGRTIVQLPQSIDFSSDAARSAAAKVYDAHPDLTVLIRDHDGVERAGAGFAGTTVQFCPDLAFGADLAIPPDSAPEVDVVFLARRDPEAVHRLDDDAVKDLTTQRVDWSLGPAANVQWWSLAIAEALVGKVPGTRPRTYGTARRAMDHRTTLNLDAAIRRLARGRVVVTDRLHGGVLAALLGIPVVLVDNVNRKVSAIHRDYLGRCPRVELATDFDDAVGAARRILHDSDVIR